MKSELGILGYGGYIPSHRVSREEIAAAHAWLNPAIRSSVKGERSVAGWDEDVVTMAIEAGRDCLAGLGRPAISDIWLGTTTAPFSDRLNAGIVADALGSSETTTAQDLTGSQRAGTSALRCGFDTVAARGGLTLVVASERRTTAAATSAELTAGHGAAAIAVGAGSGIARLRGSASVTVDFVDHFRPSGAEFDYFWEERWIRDEGYLKIVPRVVRHALDLAGIAAPDVSRFCLHCPLTKVDRQIAKAIGIPEERVGDPLSDGCGDTGAAHPLVMLTKALEEAAPGDVVVMVGFGQGVDAFVFETTDAIVDYQSRGTGVRKWLGRRLPCTYPRYISLNGLLRLDRGIRAEVDKGTALTALYRHRTMISQLEGGRCKTCGTCQIPSLRICVNPQCRAVDSQVRHSFADSVGKVATWSADYLTYTPDPPACYGIVDFLEGGRLMVDFADVGEDAVEVGTPVRMVFRIKDHDSARGFTRYFWKATPIKSD